MALFRVLRSIKDATDRHLGRVDEPANSPGRGDDVGGPEGSRPGPEN